MTILVTGSTGTLRESAVGPQRMTDQASNVARLSPDVG
jgi:hypothetical protein